MTNVTTDAAVHVNALLRHINELRKMNVKVYAIPGSITIDWNGETSRISDELQGKPADTASLLERLGRKDKL